MGYQERATPTVMQDVLHVALRLPDQTERKMYISELYELEALTAEQARRLVLVLGLEAA